MIRAKSLRKLPYLLYWVLKDPKLAIEYCRSRNRAQETNKHTKRVAEYRKYRASMIDTVCTATHSSIEEVRNLLDELSRIQDIKLAQQISDTSNSQYYPDYWQASLSLREMLYILCRILKPAVVIETGVANGVSSKHILQALEKNKHGCLYSIEMPPLGFTNTQNIGILVPQKLRHRWKLFIDYSTRCLPEILSNVSPIDIFFHDSEHSYSNMWQEFSIIWPHLRKGGVLVADDLLNDALIEFSEQWGSQLYVVDQDKSRPFGMVIKNSP